MNEVQLRGDDVGASRRHAAAGGLISTRLHPLKPLNP